MIARKFRHNGIIYEFKCLKRQNVINRMPSSLKSKIESYFQLIYQNEIDHELFNDISVNRCSSFKIKNLKRGMQKTISINIINEGIVDSYHYENGILLNHLNKIVKNSFVIEIFKITQNIYDEFSKAEILKLKPSHDEILTNILLQNEDTLSIETPIWTRKQKKITDFIQQDNLDFRFYSKTSLTGHIDLIAYDQNKKSLIVIDYKPEGYFLRSLPQVATYGIMLQKNLKLNSIECMSFNKDEAWIYDPQILKNEIERILENNGNPHLKWRKLIKSL